MNAKLLFTLCILFYAVTIANGGATFNQKCRKAFPTSSNTKEIIDFNNHYYGSQAVIPNDESSSDNDDDDDDDGLEIILPPAEPHRIIFDDSGDINDQGQEETVASHSDAWHFTRTNRYDDGTSGNGNAGKQQPLG